MSNEDLTSAPCRSCKRTTRHHVLATKVVNNVEVYDNGEDFISRDTYDMLECCGCETVSLRLREWYPGPSDVEPCTYFPPSVSRSMPSWMFFIGSIQGDIQGLMREVYTALHANSRRLALMGARTILDRILGDKVGEKGSFHYRLEQLEVMGYIGRQNRDFLEAALDAGSAAAHRGYNPSLEDLNRVMDIVENALQALYVLGRDGEELKRRTPPRTD